MRTFEFNRDDGHKWLLLVFPRTNVVAVKSPTHELFGMDTPLGQDMITLGISALLDRLERAEELLHDAKPSIDPVQFDVEQRINTFLAERTAK